MLQRSLLATAILLALGACQPSNEDTQTVAPDTQAAAPVDATEPAAANPFFAVSSLPFLAPPFDRIQESHYLPAFEEGMRQHLAEIRAIADQAEPASFDNTIVAMERSGALLFRVSKVFFNLTESTSTPGLQKIQEQVAPLLAQHQDTIYLDGPLFARIDGLMQQRDALGLDAESLRLLERYHAQFVRNGAKLNEADKASLRAYNETQSKLITEFQQKLLADTEATAVLVSDVAELEGLDASGISAAAEAAKAAGKDGQYLIGLQLPSSQGILSSLKNRALRERIHQASVARGNLGNANDTKTLVSQLAELRAQRAALLGFPNHAAYVLADQMAGTPEAVDQMLADLAPAMLANAKAEAAEMQALLQADHPGATLEPWDWLYYAEKVRKARYDLDESEVKPYFEFERVLKDGLFYTMNQLYGITLEERKDLPVYHPDVRVFEVKDADGSSIGLFYADYFARPGKRGGAWMDSFVDQSGLLGTKPVVVNVMGIPKAAAGQPTLLSFDDVNTMFHEFGHAVHGLFSQVRYPMLSGTNVPRDYVEFPSQAHEDWSLDPKVLANYAKHMDSGEPMPAALIDKIIAARRHGQGFASTEYIAAAMLDMAWHKLPVDKARQDDVIGFETAALKAAGVDYALIPPRYRSTYFAHIWPGGYSAGYYAYLWSEVLAADAFQAMGEMGGLGRTSGQRLREHVLSRGMTADPMQLYINFRGHEPGTEALLERRGLR